MRGLNDLRRDVSGIVFIVLFYAKIFYNKNIHIK